MYRAQ